MNGGDQAGGRSLQIGQEQLMAVIRAMATGGRGGTAGLEDPDNPLPPGPWDPVIKIALEKVGIAGTVFGPSPQPWKVFGPFPEPWRVLGPDPHPWHVAFGPHPDPWRIAFASIAARHPEIWDIIGGTPGLADEVALNPQPLPPRFAFVTALAQSVTERAGMFQEFADAARGMGRGEGEQQGIIIVGGYVSRFVDDICGNDFRFRWPFPWPRPNWLDAEVRGIDLVVMSAQFDQGAREAFNPEVGRAFADASGRLAEAGLSRMR